MRTETIIPPQQEGNQLDTEYSITAPSPKQARKFFTVARNRLLNINGWSTYAGPLSAEFILTDKRGKEVNRQAGVGDYFKINIPGPGPAAGDGYDWVKVESMEDFPDPSSETEILSMTVRPASNPMHADKDTAHFFKDEATSTFMIERNDNTITASVHGRNEIPNASAHEATDRIRNSVVAVGAFSGFSKVQWNNLVKGLLDNIR